jgi:selenocysteine lyase/cysteine desulfurase
MQGALRYLLTLGNHLAPYYAEALQEFPDAETGLFRAALMGIEEYERDLSREVLRSFESFPKDRFRYYGLKSVQDGLWTRDPTFCLEIEGKGTAELKRLCWELGRIEVAAGDVFSAMINRYLQKEESVIRASFAHYDDLHTVRAFISTLRRILAT